MTKRKSKRRINFKAFAILFVIIAVIGGGIAVAMNFDSIKDSFKNAPIPDVLEKVTPVEIKKFEINSGKVYLAPKGKFTMKYEISTTDDKKANISFKCEDENVCTVTNEGIITAGNVGKTKVVVSVLNEKKELDVQVTDLIELKPAKYDPKKTMLPCGRYTEEENDLLDEILVSRINEAGYHTRAGVVAAGRFWLEFPYRVEYFSENGRLYKPAGQKYVDGEGRYYHKGLYLDESRYAELDEKGIDQGPATWGCKIASRPSNFKKISNGFDCSGFITWIVYNGGYDPGDIGAGITGVDDMTDLGKMIKTSEAIPRNSIKTGDLLSTYEHTGEHIALVVGQDEDNYYVAESLWKGSDKGHYGAVISTYKRSDLGKFFFWQIDMDEYYGEDGNLTDMWEIER